MKTRYWDTSKVLTSSILSASLLVAACAGKTANPVSSYRVTDENMSCPAIKAEFSYIDSQVATLIPESEKTAKNVVLGVTGWFLIVPWFFMDLSDAEEIEIKAYKERYMELEKVYARNECHNIAETKGEEVKRISSEEVSKYGEQKTVEERLSLLADLKAKGFISEDEYGEKRQKVLAEL